MSSTVFADSAETSPGESSAVQTPSQEQNDSPTTAKPDVIPFGKKDSDSLLGTRPNNGPDTSALLRQMLALVVVILVLGLACWFVLKKGLPRFRMTATARPKDIAVLETTYLPSRQTVYLLQAGSKKLLLTSGKDGLRLLADVTDGFPEQPTDENFGAVLSKQDGEGSEGQAE